MNNERIRLGEWDIGDRLRAEKDPVKSQGSWCAQLALNEPEPIWAFESGVQFETIRVSRNTGCSGTMRGGKSDELSSAQGFQLLAIEIVNSRTDVL